MKELAHAQIRELMSNYGKVDILWYDGAWSYPYDQPHTAESVASFWESEKLNAMVRELQPEILINNRSGRIEDFGTPEGQAIIRPPKDGGLWEACMTMGDDDFSYWGYKHHQTARRTPAQALLMVLHVIEHGGNIMLNVGPDADGVIPPWQQENLAALGGWIEDHAEAVYGTEATQIARRFANWHQGNTCGFFTKKGDAFYYYLYEWPGREFTIPYLTEKFSRVIVLKTGQELPCHRDANGALHVSGLPATPLDPFCTVLKMTKAKIGVETGH
jgi:alpha-L-fucosidase